MKAIRGISAVCGVMLLAAGCSGGATGSGEGGGSDGAVALEIQTSINEEHLMSQMVTKFAELAGEYSDGEIDIRVRMGDPFGELYDVSAQVGRGEVDMVGGIIAPEIDKRFNIALMGGLVKDWAEAEQVYGPEGPMLGLLQDIGVDSGVLPLALAPDGFGGTTFSGAGPTTMFPEKSYVLRVPPYKGMEALYNEMGFQTVVMDFGEVYTALQTGSIDGKGATPPQEAAETFADVSSSYLLHRSYFEAVRAILVNADWFEALEQEHQEALRRAASEANAWAWEQAPGLEQSFFDVLEEKGVEVLEFEPEDYAQIVELSQSVEWEAVENVVGSEVMDRVRQMSDEISGN